MKKITAIFLIILFLISNSGVAVLAHYCGGKLSSISFLKSIKHPCKCSKKAMKKDCCKDKISFLKVKNDVVKANIFILKKYFQKIFLLRKNAFITIPIALSDIIITNIYHPPPKKLKVPIYLMDKVFLI